MFLNIVKMIYGGDRGDSVVPVITAAQDKMTISLAEREHIVCVF